MNTLWAGDYKKLLDHTPAKSMDLFNLDADFRMLEEINQAQIYDIMTRNSFLLVYYSSKWEETVFRKFQAPYFNFVEKHIWEWPNAKGHAPNRGINNSREIRVYMKGEKTPNVVIPHWETGEKHLLRKKFEYEKDYNGPKWQKDIRMTHELFYAYSNPGEMVMDLFAGSGNGFRVCEKLGRHCIGSEIDQTALYHLRKQNLDNILQFHTVSSRKLAQAFNMSPAKIKREVNI